MGGLSTTGRLLQRLRARRAVFKPNEQGFTIVEVMIVLIVTGALFVAAAVLISGKQNQAAFNQAIQQLQSQMQQNMNEVATGYFPGNAGFKCTAGNGGPVALTSAGPNAQGENAGCIFAGKAVQFRVSGTDPEQYAVYTLAGAQKNSAGNEVQSVTEAVPKVVAPGVSSPSGFPDISTTTALQNGLTTTAAPAGMWYNNGGSDVQIGAFAIVPSFAKYSGSNIDSGAQQLSLIAISGTSLGMSKKAAADAINNNITTSTVDPSNGISICFASGGTNQSGLLTIGGGGHPLSVTLKVMQSTTTCGK